MDAAEVSMPNRIPPRTHGFPYWIALGAVLLPFLYLPMLAGRFDFIDDGNLVYPAPAMPLGDRLSVVWGKIVANYDHLGPFRPVLWCHWELAADLLQGSEFGWRLLRLLWCGFAAGMFLWLMYELGLAPWTALLAVALAMWNPYRSEIWTSLTLGEGIAMPYALLGLVCACRAPRSPRAWLWDIAGMAAVLAAMGCKNTFCGLVPAQMFLRLGLDDLPLREAWRRNGWRALLLGLTVAAPIAHLVYFKAHWHAGQYTTSPPSAAQFVRIMRSLGGAMGVDFLGVGIAACGVALLVARGRNAGVEHLACGGSTPLSFFGLAEKRKKESGVEPPHSKVAPVAALLLVIGGVAVYLPMDAMSPRYSMPAIWGLDLLLAVLFVGVGRLAASAWKKVATAALTFGIMATVVANVGKQQKFMARSNLLWETLEWVERETPPGSTIAWHCGDSSRGGLDVSEGIHFQWHLAARGRGDLRIALRDESGRTLEMVEIAAADNPSYAVWGKNSPFGIGAFADRSFAATFHLGQKHYVSHFGRVSEINAVPVSRPTSPR